MGRIMKGREVPASAARRVVFWISFALTCAALGLCAFVVGRAIQGPGAPDMSPHFAGVPPPIVDEAEEEADEASLTDQEREQLDEILRKRANPEAR